MYHTHYVEMMQIQNDAFEGNPETVQCSLVYLSDICIPFDAYLFLLTTQ